MIKKTTMAILCLLPLLPLCAQHYAEGREFQLGAPQMTYDGPFFRDSLQVQLALGWKGAQIRYTLDGSLPDEAAARYDGPVTVREDAQLQARAFHPCCRPSEVVKAEFVRYPGPPAVKSATLNIPPAPQYPGQGATTLLDGRKGSANFRDGAWLGFNGTDAMLRLRLEAPPDAGELIVSCLYDPGSWIFPPSAIEVWAGDQESGLQKTGELAPPPPGQDTPSGMRYYKIALPPSNALYWQITVRHFGPLPAWHQGAGTPAWLFIDETIFR